MNESFVAFRRSVIPTMLTPSWMGSDSTFALIGRMCWSWFHKTPIFQLRLCVQTVDFSHLAILAPKTYATTLRCRSCQTKKESKRIDTKVTGQILIQSLRPFLHTESDVDESLRCGLCKCRIRLFLLCGFILLLCGYSLLWKFWNPSCSWQ